MTGNLLPPSAVTMVFTHGSIYGLYIDRKLCGAHQYYNTSLPLAYQQVAYQLWLIVSCLKLRCLSTCGDKYFGSWRFLYILRPPNGTQKLHNLKHHSIPRPCMKQVCYFTASMTAFTSLLTTLIFTSKLPIHLHKIKLFTNQINQ